MCGIVGYAGDRQAAGILVDGLEKIIEYSNTKITVSLGSQEITFWGDDLKINSFTREGAVVQGNITSMEFSS